MILTGLGSYPRVGDTGELQRLRRGFKKSMGYRPKATRQQSTELFLVGIGFTPQDAVTSVAGAMP